MGGGGWREWRRKWERQVKGLVGEIEGADQQNGEQKVRRRVSFNRKGAKLGKGDGASVHLLQGAKGLMIKHAWSFASHSAPRPRLGGVFSSAGDVWMGDDCRRL